MICMQRASGDSVFTLGTEGASGTKFGTVSSWTIWKWGDLLQLSPVTASKLIKAYVFLYLDDEDQNHWSIGVSIFSWSREFWIEVGAPQFSTNLDTTALGICTYTISRLFLKTTCCKNISRFKKPINGQCCRFRKVHVHFRHCRAEPLSNLKGRWNARLYALSLPRFKAKSFPTCVSIKSFLTAVVTKGLLVANEGSWKSLIATYGASLIVTGNFTTSLRQLKTHEVLEEPRLEFKCLEMKSVAPSGMKNKISKW